MTDDEDETDAWTAPPSNAEDGGQTVPHPRTRAARHTGKDVIAASAAARAAARGIAGVAQRIDELQETVARAATLSRPDAATIRSLQNLDAIAQSLDDLGRVLRVFAAELPSGLCVDMAPLRAALRLEASRDLLDAAAGGRDAPPEPQTEAGTVQLF